MIEAKRIFFFSIIATFLGFNLSAKPHTDSIPSFTQFVDPYIGTGFHGHVFMGASVPLGAVYGERRNGQRSV
jgi:hypothetical protein